MVQCAKTGDRSAKAWQAALTFLPGGDGVKHLNRVREKTPFAKSRFQAVRDRGSAAAAFAEQPSNALAGLQRHCQVHAERAAMRD
jgi:hypothetical protein